MKKVIYIGAGNVRGEAQIYDYNDFIDQYNVTPGLPIKTNALGFVDNSLLSGVAASSVQLVRVADETIAIGDVVMATSDTNVALATNDGTVQQATVLGIATSAANTGQNVTVVLMGIVTNALFNAFALNAPLFLDVDGAITDDRPTAPAANFLTVIGKSLGSGSILVSIGQPNQLS